MPLHWQDFFQHTIWHSQHNRGSWFDIVYPIFNLFEALCWFGVAGFVALRARRHNGLRIELFYAAMWFAFGVTDLREAYAQQVGLIVLKGVLLGVLVVMRRIVLRRYPGARAV